MSTPQQGATGTIHDQGYQRYEGARLPQSRRWLVIARNVLTVAWKSRWGVKAPIFSAVITLVVAAGIMIVMGQLETRFGRHGPPMLRADLYLIGANKFFMILGMILSATVATAAIADDLKSGAFQFYFSRPLRPEDYVRGKLSGLLALVGLCSFAGPVVLAIVRVFIVDDIDHAVALLPTIPKGILLGTISTVGLVLPAVGLGALLGKRAAAQAAYIVYWLVLSGIAGGIAYSLDLPAVALLSLSTDVSAIAGEMFGMERLRGVPPAWQAGLAILAFSLAGYAGLRARIRSAASAGLGGV